MQLTIFCALYPEAQEIIRTFQLKKENGQTHFQVFSDEGQSIRLVLTGATAIAAATAVSEISALFPPKETDLLLNYGTCAASPEIPVGELFLCNKLTEECSGRTFYPDILYRHPFGEAQLVSGGKVRTAHELMSSGHEPPRGRMPGAESLHCFSPQENETAKDPQIYDMEAAAIYQAGNYFYGPHQMLFLKVVSDHGVEAGAENAGLNTQGQMNDIQGKSVLNVREQLAAVLGNAAPEVCAFISFLRELIHAGAQEKETQWNSRQQIQKEAAALGEQIHCSVVMQKELEQLLWYFQLTGVDYGQRLADLQRQGRIPAKDKREGKKILDELRGYLF